jgi:hypothetical protein
MMLPMRRFALLLPALAFSALALRPAPARAAAAPAPTPTSTPVLWTDNNIPAPVLKSLVKAQDLALDLRYDQALARIRAATLKAPRHPLCGVFLVATLLSRMQENFRAGAKQVPDSFFVQADRLVARCEAQREAYPDSPYPCLYLGAAYGMRGLAKLYAGHYLQSYFDGKHGDALLKQAVAIDPTLYNAYMGLGQFEYYCGSLAGILRFFLDLHGSMSKGLAMLKLCEDKGTYASRPSEVYRVQLMTGRRDYAAAAPELLVVRSRYPDDYTSAKAVFRCLGAGVNTPAMRAAAEAVLKRLDQGWRPPRYAHVNRDAMRLSLAKACLAAGDGVGARGPLSALLAAPEPWHTRALDLLSPTTGAAAPFSALSPTAAVAATPSPAL